jgi:DNA-binding SARP family transcriptional activator
VWAQERRDRLSREAAEARLRAAELLSREGRYREASSLLDGALSDDPYSERGWQLRMSLADAVGDGDGVIAAYRQCCALLEDLGLSPSAETRELVHQLRIRR